LGKVLHQTLIEVHTAADVMLAAVAPAAPARPGNYIVPSCRPIQKSGLIAFKKAGSSLSRGAVSTGLGEGQNTLKLKEVDSIM
jgi:hypothetical protein